MTGTELTVIIYILWHSGWAVAAWSQWVPKTCVKNHRKVVKLQLKQMCSDNNNIFVRAAQLDARNDELSDELCPSHLPLLNLSAKFPVFLTNIFQAVQFHVFTRHINFWINFEFHPQQKGSNNQNCFLNESDHSLLTWYSSETYHKVHFQSLESF